MDERKSIPSQIKVQLENKEPGEIIFPGDFLMFGSSEAIHTALSRLVDQKELIRLAKGIYQKPKHDPIVGQVRPSLETIAQAIASKERVIIRPTGSYALNKLGISTQVPTKVIYLTNGNSRSIKIGKGTLTFKRATPKRLSIPDEKLYLAVEAIIELGAEKISKSTFEKLVDILRYEPLENIKQSAKLAPQAVARILYKLADNLVTND